MGAAECSVLTTGFKDSRQHEFHRFTQLYAPHVYADAIFICYQHPDKNA